MSLIPNRTLTDAGNPAKPSGKAGADMLRYMNKEHSDLTIWALDLLDYGNTKCVLAPHGVFLLVSEIYERPDLTSHCRENIAKYSMNVPGIDEFKDMFHIAGFSDTIIHTKDDEFWIAVEGVK